MRNHQPSSSSHNQPAMSNGGGHHHHHHSQSSHPMRQTKMDEIDLIANSISKQSRLHFQTNNKYLNLRRLNSNRAEKFNSLINDHVEKTQPSNTTTFRSISLPIQSDCISSTNLVHTTKTHNSSNTNYSQSQIELIQNKTQFRDEDVAFLDSFSLIERVQTSCTANEMNLETKARKLISGNIDETKLNVNESIVEQLLVPNKAITKRPKDEKTGYSHIDFNLKFLETLLKPDRNEASPRSNNKVTLTTKSSNLKKLAHSPKSMADYLTRLGASAVPLDAFQHVLVNLKHAKRQSSQQQIENLSYKAIHFCRLEFVYDENFYWIVKIKRVFTGQNHVLYQMKFVRTIPISTGVGSFSSSSVNNLTQSNSNNNNSTLVTNNELSQSYLSSPNSSNSYSNQNSFSNHQTNSNAESTSFLNDSISINTMPNLNWLFSTDSEQSSLSNSLIKCFRPLGWSKRNNRVLRKPTFEATATNDLLDLLRYLKCDRIVHDPSQQSKIHFILNSDVKNKQSFFSTLDMLKENEFCEFIDDENLNLGSGIYVARIESIVAGRILIEYANRRRWVFYTDWRVRNLGWARAHCLEYVTCDQNLLSKVDAISFVKPIKTNVNPQFKVSYYLECLYRDKFYAARVIQVEENKYFRVKLETNEEVILTFYYSELIDEGFSNSEANISEEDEEQEELARPVNTSFHRIFPCKWCASNNLGLEPPSKWPKGKKFDWDEFTEAYLKREKTDEEIPVYLTKSGVDSNLFNWSKDLTRLSEEFQLGMYLECAVQTGDCRNVTLAQIKAKVGHLVFLRLEGGEESDDVNFLRIFSVDSLDLFPVGWCEMNNYYVRLGLNHEAEYKLVQSSRKPHLFWGFVNIQLDMLRLRKSGEAIVYLNKFKNPLNWCNKLVLNINCNTGTYFINSKLEKIPKCFGPGPIVLILYRLIQLLINSAEKPSKLLKLLQAPRRQIGSNSPNCSRLEFNRSYFMQRFYLKAKEKGKYTYKEVEICTNMSQLDEYLNNLCIKLKCCHQMLSYNKSPEERKSKDNLSLETKCCVYCSLNYFSTPITPNTNEQVIHLKQYVKPTVTVTASKKSSLQATSLSQNRKPAEKKPMTPLDLSNMKQNLNYSPIKTRFNLRLLESLKQSQEESDTSLLRTSRQSLESTNDAKFIKRVRKSDVTKHDDEAAEQQPKLKKTKSLRFTKTNSNEETCASSLLLATNFSNKSSTPVNYASGNLIPSIQASQQQTSPEKMQQQQQSPKSSFISNANLNNSTSTNPNPNASVMVTNSSNPIHWSTSEVCKYVTENKFDSSFVHLFKEQEIDGQAFLMLNLPTIQNYMGLKLGPAVKLAHLVERLKQHYFQQFNQDKI